MLVVKNGQIITENDIVKGKDLIIENGRINDIVESFSNTDYKECDIIDANGGFILPSIIDINSTTFEDTIYSTNDKGIDYSLILKSIDGALAQKGISIIYHSFSILNISDYHLKFKQINEISKIINSSNLLITHRLHVILDVYSTDIIDELSTLIKSRIIHELSIKSTNYIDYDNEKKSIITVRDINNLVNLAIAHNVVIVGNGLEDNVKLAWMKKSNIDICRFPSTIEISKKAIQKNVNIVYNEQNLPKMQLTSNIILENFSDKLIESLFNISTTNTISINEIWRLVTSNPAKALGIHNDYGSIESNKIANIIIVDFNKDGIAIKNIIIDGKIIN